eukprot:CAMPEP_0179439190 /NCGR_PEP_ID=MMETSP0799-20121207/22835_1 /TAXON_ID=46947 /ORGANISM="Geminigera cryophila, Strain CCMP2564" /LENGTH=81 /DNA_ID=CAMNT_0021221383 /DNA_START=343 /DNA_END=585 /DNA_ORIENTATION=-
MTASATSVTSEVNRFRALYMGRFSPSRLEMATNVLMRDTIVSGHKRRQLLRMERVDCDLDERMDDDIKILSHVIMKARKRN